VVVAVGLLRARLAESWTLGSLAEEVHLSLCQLVRAFDTGADVATNRSGYRGFLPVTLGSLKCRFAWCMVALAVMVVVSLAIGWLVAGGVLAPLRTMTARTRRISQDKLHERLALAGPADELRELGDTIDGLLIRLEAAFDAQRRFVANASHELRTPLARIRTALDVALGKPEPAPPLLALDRKIRDGLDRADRLMEGLLALWPRRARGAGRQHGARPA
jgi:signal transduction histidine kinase